MTQYIFQIPNRVWLFFRARNIQKMISSKFSGQFQKHNSLQLIMKIVKSEDTQKQYMKLRAPDIYIDKSHIDCYNWIQQYKYQFVTFGFQSQNQVFFASISPMKKTLNLWQQYKQKIWGKTLMSITWANLKVFQQKRWGETPVFVDNIWTKFCKLASISQKMSWTGQPIYSTYSPF